MDDWNTNRWNDPVTRMAIRNVAFDGNDDDAMNGDS